MSTPTNSDIQKAGFAATVLPIPSSYWSIFVFFNADDPCATHSPIGCVETSLPPSLARSSTSTTQTSLRRRRYRRNVGADARPPRWRCWRPGDVPWARHTSRASLPPSILLDSESRMLRVANAGADRTFLCCHVGSGTRSTNSRDLFSPYNHQSPILRACLR